ncbi:MAG: DUF2298 domain-containing protein, partial [Halobacteriaceae archaeon]
MALLHLLSWTLLLAALWAMGLPLAAALFPRFPDRGAALALPVALTVVGLVAYWVGHLRYGWVAPVAGVAVLAALAAVALRRGYAVPPRLARGAVAVFALAFVAMLAVRAVDAAIVPRGGEKFLDFALLRSVLRADALPPEDPWFAGRALRYYYGGPMLAAALTRLSATPPGVAYNLALATFFATIASAAYGVAGAVAALSPRRVPRRLAGAVGAFLVVAGGNLATPARLLVGHLLSPAAAVRHAEPLFAGIRMDPADAVAAYGPGQGYTAWLARYVVPGTPDVFPAWTYLNGDLRAHMLSPPFLLLVAACGVAYAGCPATDRRRRLLVFGAVPLAGGMATLVSTWALPTVAGLTWLALLLGDPDPAALLPGRVAALPVEGRLRREVGRALVAAALAAAAGGL